MTEGKELSGRSNPHLQPQKKMASLSSANCMDRLVVAHGSKRGCAWCAVGKEGS